MLIVFTTVPNQVAAEELAVKIVEARLAACVQIMPRMTSVYVWNGRVTKETEHLLLIKTLAAKFGAVSEFITANHTYDVPEIVSIDAAKVSEPYLAWINEVISG
jgi:periplasmic divalent cation tolerance protein